ncbi:MAG: L-2-hydroxyglutarate oxidase [Bacteroidota bacterium]
MQFDITIIGAGIVGLATAYKLQRANPALQLCVLEKEASVAQHQSSHNSGVIHSGIYYKPGSLKALNCQQGYRELLEFAERHNIEHDVCGKVIVATQEKEREALDNIFKRGVANGLTGIKKITPEEVKEIEPYVRSVEAIWVPQSGIIDYLDVAKTYEKLLLAAGHEVLCKHPVKNIELSKESVVIQAGQREIKSKLIINCAGLYSDKIAKLTGQDTGIKILPFRGEYYELKKDKEHFVNNLIYPVPNPDFPFLGVHYTRMIKGGIEAGPNAVLAFRREGYSRWDFQWKEFVETVSYSGLRQIAKKYWRIELGELHRSFSKKAFVKALQHLIPSVGMDDLQRGRAGVRAMACKKDGTLVDDFFIVTHPQVVNVLNAPSPAATASLAIGEEIARRALELC